VSGSESAARVDENEVVIVGVEIVCSEANDICLKDRQVCAIKLIVVH
jgi:hypothetical protein